MSKIDVTRAADIRAVLGASGTGKSHYTKAELKKASKAAVWDLEDEYSELPAVSLAQLPHALQMKGAKVRVIGSTDEKTRARQFDLFCRITLATGNCLVIVEELRFVTSPSRSPAGWSGVTLRGRKRGLRVIGTSQRPAQIDKDFLGQCTVIRCGALNYPADRGAVASVIGATPEQIAALSGYQAVIWERGKGIRKG